LEKSCVYLLFFTKALYETGTMLYERGMMSPSQSDGKDEEQNNDRPHLSKKRLNFVK
jgi:hypothetical protein